MSDSGRVRKSEIDQIAEMVGNLAVTMGESVKEQTEILRGLSDAIRAQSHGHVQQVTLPQQLPPRGERLLWVMSILVLLMSLVSSVSVVAAFFQGQRVTDLRIDMQTERLSREAMDNWTAQEVTAIRSYITNGKLQPMQPRPKRMTEEPK